MAKKAEKEAQKQKVKKEREQQRSEKKRKLEEEKAEKERQRKEKKVGTELLSFCSDFYISLIIGMNARRFFDAGGWKEFFLIMAMTSGYP